MSETPDPHPGAVLGLVGDPDRLRCLSAVVLGAASEGEVVEVTGLAARVVRRALTRLVGGELVEQASDGRLAASAEPFRRAALVAADMRVSVTPEALGASAEQAAVLRGFWHDGRLASIPAQRGKRLVVLDFLAQQFEPGRRYRERDVNAVLARFHPDYASLRRYLVDDGFVERREGWYWRAGGTFEVE